MLLANMLLGVLCLLFLTGAKMDPCLLLQYCSIQQQS